MDRLSLYSSITELLYNSRSLQNQIEKNELDLKLQAISLRYKLSSDMITQQLIRQQKIEKIESLKKNRDENLIKALYNTIYIIKIEFNDKIELLFSIGNLALSNIISFLDTYKINLNIPMQVKLDIKKIKTESVLIYKGIESIELINKLDRLLMYC